MATSYTGLRVQDTYNAIIKIGDNSNLTSTAKLLSDGLGNDSPLYLSGTRLGIGISPDFQFHTSGNAKIGGNLIISGNLTVNGTLTYLNVEDLAVEDPLIKLAKDNTANTLDIGLFGKYVATGTKYKGFFNDASDDKFKLFIGTTVEPTTTVDTSASGYTKGNLVIGNLEATGGDFSGTVYIDDHLEIENSSGYGYIELGGSSGGYLDLKGPFSNDFDLRVFTDGTNSQINAIAGSLDITANSGIDLQYQGNNKLTVISTGIDVTGNLFVSGGIKDSDGDLGTSGQLLSSTGTGTNWIDFEADVAKRLDVTVKNVSGGSLAKGVVVHAAPTATPPSGNVIEVIAADANDAAKMPAIGVLNETIADEAEGEAVMFGAVSGIDTSSFSIGDELYVSETAGAFTATKPTAFTSQVQKIAVVIKSHASNGLIKVFGAGRSNDVPNRVDRNMNFTDDSELTFGDSSDLKIYHTTNNIVRINSGDLIFNSFVDDGDIKFQLDDGSDPAGLTEYMRLDGGVQRVIYSKSIQMVDDLKLYFGNDTTNDASVKWDSTASQLFIDGESKFLNDLYVVGDLIVDTDTLFVDVSANKVGINNSAPGAMLTVGDAINVNATGLEVNAGTGGGNIISRGAGYDNWFPYVNGQNYYSSDTHNFRNTASSAAQLTIDSGGNGTFVGAVTASSFSGPLTGNVTGNVTGNLTGNVTGGTISGTTGTFSDIVYVGDDASSNEGVYIKSGNGTSDYGVVRFYHGGTNQNTIHAFGSGWQSGTIYGHSTGTINIDGYAGVTFGPWNNIDAAFVQGGTNYFQRSVGIGQTTPLSSLHITQSIPSITLETSANANDPVITLKSDSAIGVEGAQMYYDNSVGTFHIQTTYPNDAADIVFHTATGADQGTNNVRMRIGGGGGVGIGDVSANGDLQFSNDVNTRKIVLWEGADNDYQFYGFGVESGTFIYSTYLESDSHVFVSGASATTRTEIMRLTANTGVRVGTGSVDAKFKVEARDTSNNIYAGFRVGYNGGSANYYDANSHYIRSGSSGTTYLTINSSGASFNKSIIIGTSGTYAAGAIYSDSNWGMILRAKQASPVVADFMFANSDDVERLRITSTAATFAGEVNLVRGINMTAGTSNLYATDGALSYYSASNGVYLNGAGASGWLRLNASGVQNDRNSINIYGYSAGAFINFRTENTERLRIDASGNLGVGNSSPSSFNSLGGKNVVIGDGTQTNNLFLYSATTGATVGYGHIAFADSNTSGSTAQYAGLIQYYHGNDSMQFYTNATPRMTLVNSGNMGVGTFDPDAFMSGTNGISIVGNYASLGLSNGTTKWLTYLTSTADRYRIWNSTNNEVMTILLSGRVGIGNDGPNHLLELGASGSVTINAAYNMFSAGAFGVLFRNNYDCYIAGNTQYGASAAAWVNKYSGRKSSIIALADGQIEFNIGTGTTAGSASNLTVKSNTTTNGTTFYVPAQGTASGDCTNVQYYPYKVDSATQSGDYWRIPHLSGHSAVAGVYNYQTGKNVYWGEPSDTGTYNFRGRYITAVSSNTIVGEFHNDLTTALFKIGDTSNSSYSDLIIASNSGTGEIFKAGTGYGSWGGALALNIYNSNGDICFHPSATANIMKVKTSGITVTGSVTASGDVIAFSDKRVKTNIKTIDNGLQKVLNLRGVSYNRTDIDDKSNKIGVIAQEVKKVLPEVVSYDDEKDLLGVDYGKMAGLFIEAIKELKSEIEELKKCNCKCNCK